MLLTIDKDNCQFSREQWQKNIKKSWIKVEFYIKIEMKEKLNFSFENFRSITNRVIES